MNDDEQSQPEGTEETSSGTPAGGFPVDLRAITLGLWKLRWLIAAGLAGSLLAGFLAAAVFAKRTFSAQSLMLYQAPPAETPEAATMPSLLTLLNMVKLPDNLESVNKKLKLGTDIRTLGGATSVELQPKTTLVMFSAIWDSPKRAAEIANTLRDTFLETQTRLRRDEAEGRVRDLQSRMTAVNGQMAAAEEKLRVFTKDNRVVMLSEEARALLVELSSVNLLVEQARLDKRSVEIQAESAGRIIKELQDSMAKEQEAQAVMSDAMSETNIRIQRLRESIMDDKEKRTNDALLQEASIRWERAVRLREAGAIPQEELDAAVANLRTLEAQAVDTPQIAAWKAEMEKLDKSVIPKPGGGGGVTGNLLKDIMFKSFEIRLQQTTVAEKVQSLEQAKARVEERLARLPDLQRTFAQLTRDVSAFEAERSALEVRMAEARRLLEASALPFTLVSEAIPPLRTSSSDAKKIAIGVAFLLGAITIFVGLALAALDPRIRTRRELEIVLAGPPVLCEVPGEPKVIGSALAAGEPPMTADAFRQAARLLRTLMPARGARMLVTSVGFEEGAEVTAENLAAILGRWDEKVLLIDARLRPSSQVDPEIGGAQTLKERARAILGLISTKGLAHSGRHLPIGATDRQPAASPVGFAELLSTASLPLSAAVQETGHRGVSVIAPSEGAASPDLLATDRFRTLLAEASAQYSLVLIVAAPITESTDAENISAATDGVLLVVRAMGPFGMAIRSGAEKLSQAGSRIIGAVLSGTAEPFAISPGIR